MPYSSAIQHELTVAFPFPLQVFEQLVPFSPDNSAGLVSGALMAQTHSSNKKMGIVLSPERGKVLDLG